MTLKKITPEQLFKKMNNQENLVVLDVRAEEKFNNYHISDANVKTINIEKTKIFKLEEEQDLNLPSLTNESEMIVTCTTGNSATKCANILSERDYDVLVLEGGITAWKDFLSTRS